MNEDSHDLFSALWGDRPALQENWIKYKLFPPPNPQVISATSSAHTLLKEIQLVLNPIVGQHIWQHEEFELTVQADGTLEGCTKFGDNIEDEWFIVHLLLVATQTFPGLVGRVEDNDGQFLCIESALHLPSWMTPQNSSNRIFLYNGTVHVISPDTCRNLDDQSIGVDFIRSTEVNTAAPSNMCRAILFRTNVFPETARNSIHHAHCFLPYRVALLLRLRPKLVAAATRAFYYRTAEETAMCTQMTTFPPLESSRVAVSVPFTRCLYAQLSQQEFPPPPQFQSWYTSSSSSTNTHSGTNNNNTNNSSTTNTTNTTSNNTVAHARATDIGMRLTCGFEMLCAKHPDINKITESNSIAKRFELFCRQLTAQNFFVSVTNEQERLTKMSVARDFFNRQEEITQKSNKSTEITGAVDAPLSAPSFPTCLAEIAVPEGNMDWLRNSSELDAKMANYSTTPNTETSAAQKDMQSAHEMASRLAEEMKEFVSATSDYSGVESSAPASAPTTATTAATNSSDTSFALDLDKLLGILGNDVTGFDVERTETTQQQKGHNEDEIAKEDAAIAEAMTEELLESTLASTFTASSDVTSSPSTNVNNGCGTLEPLDLDVNLISNMLESYSAQQGLPGPVSNMCGDLGLVLPDNESESN